MNLKEILDAKEPKVDFKFKKVKINTLKPITSIFLFVFKISPSMWGFKIYFPKKLTLGGKHTHQKKAIYSLNERHFWKSFYIIEPYKKWQTLNSHKIGNVWCKKATYSRGRNGKGSNYLTTTYLGPNYQYFSYHSNRGNILLCGLFVNIKIA